MKLNNFTIFCIEWGIVPTWEIFIGILIPGFLISLFLYSIRQFIDLYRIDFNQPPRKDIPEDPEDVLKPLCLEYIRRYTHFYYGQPRNTDIQIATTTFYHNRGAYIRAMKYLHLIPIRRRVNYLTGKALLIGTTYSALIEIDPRTDFIEWYICNNNKYNSFNSGPGGH